MWFSCSAVLLVIFQNGNGSLVVSVDANFGLVRKRSAGQSIVPSNINTYFINQKEVDDKLNILPIGEKNTVVYDLLL